MSVSMRKASDNPNHPAWMSSQTINYVKNLESAPTMARHAKQSTRSPLYTAVIIFLSAVAILVTLAALTGCGPRKEAAPVVATVDYKPPTSSGVQSETSKPEPSATGTKTFTLDMSKLPNADCWFEVETQRDGSINAEPICP